MRPIVFHCPPGPARAPLHVRALLMVKMSLLGKTCRERALGTTLDCLGVQGLWPCFPRSRVKFDQGGHTLGGTLVGHARRGQPFDGNGTVGMLNLAVFLLVRDGTTPGFEPRERGAPSPPPAVGRPLRQGLAKYRLLKRAGFKQPLGRWRRSCTPCAFSPVAGAARMRAPHAGGSTVLREAGRNTPGASLSPGTRILCAAWGAGRR